MTDDRPIEIMDQYTARLKALAELLVKVEQLRIEKVAAEQQAAKDVDFFRADANYYFEKWRSAEEREQRLLGLFSDYEMPCTSFEQAHAIWNELRRKMTETEVALKWWKDEFSTATRD